MNPPAPAPADAAVITGDGHEADAIAPAELRRIARALTMVENRAEGYEAQLAQAYRLQRWADVIGITGPPGVGKSTLVDTLTAHWAEGGERVAVLAIDPSSPYSGGALLGDRIRRARSGAYQNTYFRSLSARGHVGGLSETATDLIAVMSLFGFRRVIVETVGAGQSDVEIHATADCTVVVTVPGLGDGVQAAKAGLMEIGDVFVVNKADMPGASQAARMIENALAAAYMGEPGINARAEPTAFRQNHVSPGLKALHRRHGEFGVDASSWVPPVMQAVATEALHVAELAAGIDSFVKWSDTTGRRVERGRDRAYAQIMRALAAELLAPYARAPGDDDWPAPMRRWIERILQGQTSPLEAARALIDEAAR